MLIEESGNSDEVLEPKAKRAAFRVTTLQQRLHDCGTRTVADGTRRASLFEFSCEH
jgi:hypothetical protein